jgi:hypothetical protein
MVNRDDEMLLNLESGLLGHWVGEKWANPEWAKGKHACWCGLGGKLHLSPE